MLKRANITLLGLYLPSALFILELCFLLFISDFILQEKVTLEIQESSSVGAASGEFQLSILQNQGI